jgi:hypothetical protein
MMQMRLDIATKEIPCGDDGNGKNGKASEHLGA